MVPTFQSLEADSVSMSWRLVIPGIVQTSLISRHSASLIWYISDLFWLRLAVMSGLLSVKMSSLSLVGSEALVKPGAQDIGGALVKRLDWTGFEASDCFSNHYILCCLDELCTKCWGLRLVFRPKYGKIEHVEKSIQGGVEIASCLLIHHGSNA